MGPLLIVAALLCLMVVALVVALALSLARSNRVAHAQQQDLTALREEIAALTARQVDLEAAQVAAPADYVITFDQPRPETVPTVRVASVTLGEAMIKATAFGHGVRRALREESRARLGYQVRREYRRRRKASRTAARRSG
jgi:hypothetical protein